MRTGRNHSVWLLVTRLLSCTAIVASLVCFWHYPLTSTAALFLVSTATVCVVRHFEGYFIFFPLPYPEGDWSQLAEVSHVDELFIETRDGETINALFFRAANDPLATILFFHGNAGNLTHRYQWCEQLRQKDFNLLAIDYRGYGKSTGRPSEYGIYADAEAAYDYLKKHERVDESKIVIYGKSLGGGPAAELATKKKCCALILQSTFTSIGDMARTIVPAIPLSFLLATKFETNEKLATCNVPTLVIHSKDDELIPVWMAVKNGQSLPRGKTKLFSGADHNGLITEKSEALLTEIANFITTVTNHLETS